VSPARARPQSGLRAAPQAPDPDVMRRLATGDLGALGELYDRYHEPIRRFFARATSDAEDVDDLVHATFLAAAKTAGRYDGRPSCRPWLIGIAAQFLRRRRRTVGRFLEVLSSLRGSRAAIADPRPSLEARGDIERALGRVSEVKRITLLMSEVEGLSCAEIAAALEVPIGTVWTRLHAARRELRRALDGTSSALRERGQNSGEEGEDS
jgi:RNA polymerase sigma-70 factor (ECF subfamily)